MKKVNEFEIVPAVMKQINEGAFLTVEAKGQKNVMTIGWALVGILWKKSVLMVAVRNSRHTFIHKTYSIDGKGWFIACGGHEAPGPSIEVFAGYDRFHAR